MRTGLWAIVGKVGVHDVGMKKAVTRDVTVVSQFCHVTVAVLWAFVAIFAGEGGGILGAKRRLFSL